MGANATNAEIVTLDVVETLKTDGEVVTSLDTVEVVTTTNVITAAESGRTFVLNSATAFVSTLPAKAAGLRYRFYAGATQVTGGNHTIVCSNDDNTIFGSVTVAGVLVAGTVEGSINFVADTMLPGDWCEVYNDGTNWYVSGQATASGAITLTT
jgi:hypothetical protein|tara:strand:- start:38 stop:499 length:462 start_codon:yes stop_codon:yes gene_type:complete